MNKKIFIGVAVMAIGSVLLASSRMGRPLHNSPANIPMMSLEASAPEMAALAQALLPLPEGFDNPDHERVICFDMGISHAQNAHLSGGSLLPISPSSLQELEKKEKIQKIDVSKIMPMQPILTEDEQREAAAYRQKLEAGDLKQQKENQWSADEELGTYC
jgi:hypothetical protein